VHDCCPLSVFTINHNVILTKMQNSDFCSPDSDLLRMWFCSMWLSKTWLCSESITVIVINSGLYDFKVDTWLMLFPSFHRSTLILSKFHSWKPVQRMPLMLNRHLWRWLLKSRTAWVQALHTMMTNPMSESRALHWSKAVVEVAAAKDMSQAETDLFLLHSTFTTSTPFASWAVMVLT